MAMKGDKKVTECHMERKRKKKQLGASQEEMIASRETSNPIK